MDGRGRWMDNIFIERLWRSMKYEEVHLKGYADAREARAGIGSMDHLLQFAAPAPGDEQPDADGGVARGYRGGAGAVDMPGQRKRVAHIPTARSRRSLSLRDRKESRAAAPPINKPHQAVPLRGSISLRSDGSPPITRITIPACRAQYPGRPNRCICQFLPCSHGLPQVRDGSASASTFSRPARTSLTLRPTGSLNRPRRPLSRGFGPAGYPTEPLVSFQTNRQLSGWNLPP